jgi:hypothetical protein
LASATTVHDGVDIQNSASERLETVGSLVQLLDVAERSVTSYIGHQPASVDHASTFVDGDVGHKVIADSWVCWGGTQCTCDQESDDSDLHFLVGKTRIGGEKQELEGKNIVSESSYRTPMFVRAAMVVIAIEGWGKKTRTRHRYIALNANELDALPLSHNRQQTLRKSAHHTIEKIGDHCGKKARKGWRRRRCHYSQNFNFNRGLNWNIQNVMVKKCLWITSHHFYFFHFLLRLAATLAAECPHLSSSTHSCPLPCDQRD